MKMWPLDMNTSFFNDLTLWPTFWPHMTQFQTWPRFCQEQHSDQISSWFGWKCGLKSEHKLFLWFDLVTYFLTSHDPISSSWLKILSRTTFWPSFKLIWLKMWPLEWTQAFSMIWPSDLLFDLTWPNFKLDRDFVRNNILTKFQVDSAKNVASRVNTSFFYDLTKWPTFWPHMTQFSNLSEILSRTTFWPSFKLIGLKMWPLEWTQVFSMIWPCDLLFDLTWPNFKLSEILSREHNSEQISSWFCWKCGLRVNTSFFNDLTCDLLFDLTWPNFELVDFVSEQHSDQVSSWFKGKMWPLEWITSFFWWFDPVTYFLTSHDPISNLTEILSRTTFWPSFKLIGLKMWPLEWTQAFSMIWIQGWPTFWPHMTQFRTWPRFCQEQYSDQVSSWFSQKCGL